MDVPSRPKKLNVASGFCVIKFKLESLILSECQKYFVNSILQGKAWAFGILRRVIFRQSVSKSIFEKDI